MLYNIMRYYRDSTKKPVLVMSEVSLEQAQAHCSRPDTQGDDWFDGYVRCNTQNHEGDTDHDSIT